MKLYFYKSNHQGQGNARIKHRTSGHPLVVDYNTAVSNCHTCTVKMWEGLKHCSAVFADQVYREKKANINMQRVLRLSNTQKVTTGWKKPASKLRQKLYHHVLFCHLQGWRFNRLNGTHPTSVDASPNLLTKAYMLHRMICVSLWWSSAFTCMYV